MIDINARGYVSNAESKVSKGGKAYSKFTLGVKQKDKGFNGAPDTVTWANYEVTNFNSPNPPDNKAYVTLSGYLKVRKYESNGVQRQSLDVIAKELTIAPPFEGRGVTASDAPAPAAPKEPWDE